MRSVERTPWAVQRTSMHDAISLLVTEQPDRLCRIAAPAMADLLPQTDVPRGIDRVLVEHPCGTGFCDIVIETDGRERAWFVEVKTDAERASAGDIIRQLRWYAGQCRGYSRKELVLVTETLPDPSRWMLLCRAGVRVVPAWCLERKASVGHLLSATAIVISDGPISSSESNEERSQQ